MLPDTEQTRFGPVEVAYDERVLEPRPWTLAQAEWAAELAGGTPILELGCGAGQIGLAAAALSGSPVVQVDRDPVACNWAARNAAANGLARLVTQRCGTPAGVLGAGERFDVIIADPPYVPTLEVARYPGDPVGAIDGGLDGLASIREFLIVAAAHLAPDGAVVLQARGRRQVMQAWTWLARAGAPPLRLLGIREHDALRALGLFVGRD